MRTVKIVILALSVISLSTFYVLAEEGTCAYEGAKSSSCVPGAAGSAEVKGKIYFSDYYAMGGEKCAAFLEAEDGSLVCVLDNLKANSLRTDMKNMAGKVELRGNIKQDTSGMYMSVEDYKKVEN